MKRAWAVAFTLLAGGTLASCASLLGADGDYEIAAASVAASSSASGSGGSGGDPAATVAASSSSASASSSASSGAGGAPSTSWHRYSFDMATKTWSSELLSNVWTGANAPPSTGIVATCHLDLFDKLLVFTDEGTLYTLEGGAWSTPMPATVLFKDPMHPEALKEVSHVPVGWEGTPSMPFTETLTLTNNPMYWIYDFTESGTKLDSAGNSAPPDGVNPSEPSSVTMTAQWTFSVWNKSVKGMADRYVTWSTFRNGLVYKKDGLNTWSSWPVASDPIWAGAPGAPDWTTLEAAYFDGNTDTGLGEIRFIGP